MLPATAPVTPGIKLPDGPPHPSRLPRHPSQG